VYAGHRKRWQAQIRYDNKQHNLGTFDTKQEAALAYDREARQCGEDKPLNYESIAAAEEAVVQAQAEHLLTHPKQTKPRPASGFYGVAASGKRWSAIIYYDSKTHHLSSFDTKQEAALAYDREARQCGEDKLLNYESIAAAEEAAAHAQAEHTLAHPQQPQQPRPRPASGFYGVYTNGKRWAARSKNHHLGSFETKQEAALAYDRAARQHGEDELLNYESIAAAEEAAVQAQSEHTLAHPQQPQQPRARPASGFYGVRPSGKRWQASIRYDSKNHHLSCFETKQEAALAYDREARQCGEHKPLNYESIKAAEEAAALAQTEHALIHPKQSKPRPASGFYGVSAHGKRWKASICYDGKEHTLGRFDTKQEAALAYDREARQCGKDKPLNYESIAAAEEAAAQAQAEVEAD
jgi:hypothetical protein